MYNCNAKGKTFAQEHKDWIWALNCANTQSRLLACVSGLVRYQLFTFDASADLHALP